MTYITTPDHSIQSTTQGTTQALRVVEHLRHVMDSDSCSLTGGVQFYVSPTLTPDRCSTSSDGVS
ncbi:hypothetical protein HKD37_09G024689 [Glycine soja]|nr:hypothetical protein GmHk_09G025023 [Glycine max]